MAYAVSLGAAFRRQFRRLPRDIQQRVSAAVLALENDPRPPGSTKLAGFSDHYRIRIGSYRVVYAIRDEELLVLVVRVGHRRDVYRGL